MANQIVKLKKGSDYLYPYANFMGIDTANVLATINSGSTYTATEDCWFQYSRWINGSSASAYIDGVQMYREQIAGGSGIDGKGIAFPLKKGQTITSYNASAQATIYGIKY